ncbi:unnamed protein product [Rotaria sp. Silwood2]|nr:unnamed protein product [Rotaria sp. Silwood2]CAF4449936.1 unnamed protein product [Rotaria sp. Silwood2]CAF4494259.1 unnamed protein product [Rotaria sp. Silwood2]
MEGGCGEDNFTVSTMTIETMNWIAANNLTSKNEATQLTYSCDYDGCNEYTLTQGMREVIKKLHDDSPLLAIIPQTMIEATITTTLTSSTTVKQSTTNSSDLFQEETRFGTTVSSFFPFASFSSMAITTHPNSAGIITRQNYIFYYLVLASVIVELLSH